MLTSGSLEHFRGRRIGTAPDHNLLSLTDETRKSNCFVLFARCGPGVSILAPCLSINDHLL